MSYDGAMRVFAEAARVPGLRAVAEAARDELAREAVEEALRAAGRWRAADPDEAGHAGRRRPARDGAAVALVQRVESAYRAGRARHPPFEAAAAEFRGARPAPRAEPAEERRPAPKVDRHLAQWLERLQGLESAADAAKDLGDVEAAARAVAAALEARGVAPRLARPAEVRAVAEALRLPAAAPHTPLLHGLVTGAPPPALGAELTRRVATVFVRVGDAGARGRRSYPYTLYKILDLLLPAGEPARRLLDYIELPDAPRLAEEDREWAAVCAELGDPAIAYRPTIR